jgi:hypothetical protein
VSVKAPKISASRVVPLPPTTGTEPCQSGETPFTLDDYGYRRPEVKTAKRLCQHCPLAPACLAWALANPTLSEEGIWGGTTPRQRNTLRKRLHARLGSNRVDGALRKAYDTALEQLVGGGPR